MNIIASVGLAQNFGALRSLLHLEYKKDIEMHLTNLLNKHKASENEKEQVFVYFKDKLVSSSS